MSAPVSVKLDESSAVENRRVYISGPMSGLPDLNFPAFHEAAAYLRAKGFNVVNPAEKQDEGRPDMTWADYLRLDIKLLMDCDAIYMLEGWASSKGARLERTIALSLGFTIWQQGAL